MHQDPFKSLERNPYMTHHIAGQSVRETRFVPYEDVLGIGHSQGMSSIVVPGRSTPFLPAQARIPSVSVSLFGGGLNVFLFSPTSCIARCR